MPKKKMKKGMSWSILKDTSYSWVKGPCYYLIEGTGRGKKKEWNLTVSTENVRLSLVFGGFRSVKAAKEYAATTSGQLAAAFSSIEENIKLVLTPFVTDEWDKVCTTGITSRFKYLQAGTEQ